MRAIPAVFTVGLAVMLYCGRTTWLSGGGVLMPQLSAKVVKDDNGTTSHLVLRNTGNETLVKLSGSTTRWNLHKQTKLCAELARDQELRMPIVGNVDGDQIFVFAEGYWLPASFILKPEGEGLSAIIKSWLP